MSQLGVRLSGRQEHLRDVCTKAPGQRDWYANLLAHPAFAFHLKQTVQADLPARATPILEPAQRREILTRIHQSLGGGRDLEAWEVTRFFLAFPRHQMHIMRGLCYDNHSTSDH